MRPVAPVNWVSWPSRTPQGGRIRRRASVRGWTPPPDDPIDAETGEPRIWEAGHVRTWIREAMETLHRLPMPQDGLPRRLRSHMPEIVRDLVEAYGYEADRPRPGASAAEIARLDRVLDWLLQLRDRREALIVTAVAMGLNLRAVGRLVGRSHEWCRQKERAAVARIAQGLNDRPGAGAGSS